MQYWNGTIHNVNIAMGGQQSVPEVDLHDKVVVITGGNNGIGYETAKAVAVMGAHTIIACRSKERATAVSHRIVAVLSRYTLRLWSR